MLDLWRALVDKHLEACHIGARPLEGINARIRHSRRPPFSSIGEALSSALKHYGADIKLVDDMSYALENDIAQVQLADIDAFIMLACTTGVSAEALELAHVKIAGDRSLKDSLHVAMPKEFAEGFICKRLAHHRVSLDLYSDDALKEGIVCVRAINKLVEWRRKEQALEQAKLNEFKPTIGILTALPIEYQAVTSLLQNPRSQRLLPRRNALRDYTHGTLPAYGEGEHQVVVAMVGLGNNSAAAMTERLLDSYDLDEVVVVGIAGGIPYLKAGHTDLRLGDVVISGRDGVVQYDMVKRKPDHSEPNWPPRPPSAAWLSRAQLFINTDADMDAFNARLQKQTKENTKFKRPPATTDKLFDDSDPSNPVRIRRPSRPAGRSYAFEGAIGSGNTVLKSHRDREQLREQHKLLAVEMEGSGAADAAVANGKSILVIRGVADYANTLKNDIWHPFAAMSAAVFAASLIESMPLVATED